MKGLSFVLCCHNSASVIEDCISAVQNQKNNSIPFEVILVDNGCEDRTVDIATNAWSRKDIMLRITSERKPGLIHARKKGVSCAKFDYISFIDDDNFVEEKWVRKVCCIFEKNMRIGAVGGRNIPFISDSAPRWFYRVQNNYACGRQLPESGFVKGRRKHLWGAGLSLRKEIVDDIFSGKYQLLMTGRSGARITSGDDSEICFICQLKDWKLWYEDNLVLHHKIADSRLDWKYFCKLHEGFGRANFILNIYKRKIDNLPPNKFRSELFDSLSSLLTRVIKNRGVPKRPIDGNFLQKEIYYYWGMTMAACRHWKDYNSIVQKIYGRKY